MGVGWVFWFCVYFWGGGLFGLVSGSFCVFLFGLFVWFVVFVCLFGGILFSVSFKRSRKYLHGRASKKFKDNVHNSFL